MHFNANLFTQMLYSDQNPFERETYMLERSEARQEVLLIFEAAEFMAESKWTNALVKIKKYRELPRGSRPAQPALEKETQLMEAFCLYHLNNLEEAEHILMSLLEDLSLSRLEKSIGSHNSSYSSQNGKQNQLQKSLAVRAYTFAATIIIIQEETALDYKEIKESLVELLKPKDMHIFIPEVLGTITGCKYFQPLIAFKDLPGIHHPKLARKLQLVADWKFVADLPHEAIEFKRRARNLWELLNCRKEFEECQSQLKDLESKAKSPYLLKLSRIKVFAEGLIKIQVALSTVSKQNLLKWKIPILIDEILPARKEQKSKKQTGVAESKPQREDQKKLFLQDIVAMSNSFYKVYRQEICSEATNLIQNSKFLEEQVLSVRKRLAILVKLRSLRLRDAWRRIRLTAFPDKPVLNSGVLREKNSAYF